MVTISPPQSWADGPMSAFVCANICVWARVCHTRCLKWKSVQQQNCLLSFMPFAHVCKHTHTHLCLLKAHIRSVYSLLSCCRLWMGTAAYLQWIVNPAKHSAVRVLWIANVLYLALRILFYQAPITCLVCWAKKQQQSTKRTLVRKQSEQRWKKFDSAAFQVPLSRQRCTTQSQTEHFVSYTNYDSASFVDWM